MLTIVPTASFSSGAAPLSPGEAPQLRPRTPSTPLGLNETGSRSRLPPAWWLLALLPPDVRVAVDLLGGHVALGRWALGFAPALALLALVTWSHASGRAAALHLRKELRLIGPLALALLPAGGALMELPGVLAPGLGWAALSAGAFFVALRSFGAEASAGTFTRWVLQPRSSRWLVASKYVALALVLGPLTLETTLTTMAPEPSELVWIMVGLAITMGPWFGLMGGVPIASATSPWVLLFATVSIAGAALIHDALFVPSLFFWGLVCVVATFRHMRRLEVGQPWARMPGSALWDRSSRVGPRLALLRKELRLQSGPAAMGGAMLYGWILWVVFSSADVAGAAKWAPGEAVTVLLLVLGWGGAALAGAGAFAEERTLGTLTWQEALVPRAQLFWAKVGAALLTSLLVSLVLPAVLLSVAPGRLALEGSIGVGVLLTFGALWSNFVLAACAVGILASTRQRDTTKAFITTLGMLAGAAVVVALAVNVALSLVAAPFDSLADLKQFCGGRRPSPELAEWAGRAAQAITFTPMALVGIAAVALARRWWRGRATLRPVLLAVALVFVGSTAVFTTSVMLVQYSGRWFVCPGATVR